MKVIVSHDIDHLTAWEHRTDLVIPKFIVRSLIEFSTGMISFSECSKRIKELIENKWHNIEELMAFDKEKKVSSTFFIGMNNGLGLSYSIKDAGHWLKKIMNEGFDIGVHGICYNEIEGMKKEFEMFNDISGLTEFGIRMHYLRKDSKTSEHLDNIGYVFDTSITDIKSPFKVGGMWEFPLHIMDSNVIYQEKKWQNKNLKEIKDHTLYEFERIYKKNIDYMTILFHDRYFSNGFVVWREWYVWLIEWIKQNSFEFISYRNAINELENIE